MSVASSKKILDIAQASDPKEGICKAVGDLSDKFWCSWDQILVGTYIQPERRKSGLYLATETLREDEFQGVVGLILEMGPDAIKLAEETGGPQVGDWIVYSIRQSWPQTVNGAPCRMMHYGHHKARVSHPNVIYGV